MKQFVEIGRIQKTFGNKGDLIIYPSAGNDFTLFHAGEWIFVHIDSELVPFMLKAIEPLSDLSALVRLKGITMANAGTFTGLRLYTPHPAPCISSSNHQIIRSSDDITGFKVIDRRKGDIGIVNSIIRKQFQDLLEINHNNTMILLPIDEHIIRKVDSKARTIIVSAPEGLIDIYI